jgi:hypothetical protein
VGFFHWLFLCFFAIVELRAFSDIEDVHFEEFLAESGA